MSSEIGGLIGGILGIAFAIILVWAFYPALVQLGGVGWGALFVVLSMLLIIGAIIGLGKR